MSFENWLAYVATVLILMSTPGPSHLLMLSTSLSNGFARSTATAVGDLTANTLQILAAGFGLAAVLSATRYGFAAVKWAGVAYLVWLGVRQILRSVRSGEEAARPSRIGLGKLWMQGFVTSAANPKAVVFFAALFPQFLNPDRGLGYQLLILGGTYIVLDGVFLLAYGLGARWLGARLRGPAKVWLDRLAGGFLIGAALLLGLKSIQRS